MNFGLSSGRKKVGDFSLLLENYLVLNFGDI